MSDQFGPDDQHDGTTPPPPPPPRPLEPELTLDTEAEVASSSSGIGGRVLAGVVGVALLVGGTVFAVTQLGASGPDSAEAAVSELLDAASDEDLVGMMAALDPGERDALRGPVEDMFGELQRLEVLADSFDLGGVNGVDFEFADVTYRTEPVRDDLMRVYLTGGTVTTGFDTDELPIGDFVTDAVERFGGELGGFQDSETADIYEDGTDEIFLVARNGDDGWRVSIGYTIAEAARLDSGQPLPTAGIDPIGADSPEAAVEGMVGALTDLDLRGAIARLSPAEFAAMHDYADMFLGPAEAEIAEIRDEFEITVDDLTLRADVSGDTATVFVDGASVTFEAEGEGFSMSFDDECITIEGDMEGLDLQGSPFEDGPVCTEDLEDFSNDLFDDMGFGEGDSESIEFPQIETPEIGITTQRVDGEWFVAPIATSLDAMVSGLEVLERSHLDAMVDFVEQFFLGFEQSFEEFEEVGEAIGGEQFPTTTFVPGSQDVYVDDVALEEFLLAYTGDEKTATCMLAELTPAGEQILAELADSYTFDYEPSPDAQDAFFTASDACL